MYVLVNGGTERVCVCVCVCVCVKPNVLYSCVLEIHCFFRNECKVKILTLVISLLVIKKQLLIW